MKYINLLVLCKDREQERLKELLNNRYDTNLIIFNEKDYNKFIDYLNKHTIDLILIENSITNKISILEKYNNKEDYSKTIIVDDYKLECYKHLDNNLFNIFPSDYNKDLLYICLDIVLKTNIHRCIPLYQQISSILDKTKIPTNMMGYVYLRKAIYEIFKDESLKYNFNSKLYPLLSKTYNKSICSIEKAMRSTITKAMNNTNDEYNNKLFSKYITYDKTTPTTQEFILTIVDNLLNEYGKVS